jgi:hypothetical protein
VYLAWQLGNSVGAFMEYLATQDAAHGVASNTSVTSENYDIYVKLYAPEMFPRRLAYLDALFEWAAPQRHAPLGRERHHLVSHLLGALLHDGRGPTGATGATGEAACKKSLLASSQGSDRPVRGLTTVQAFHHLFVWALLCSKVELARIFWIRGGVCGSLAPSR